MSYALVASGRTDVEKEYCLHIQNFEVVAGLASTKFINIFVEDPRTTDGKQHYCCTVELSKESAITPLTGSLRDLSITRKSTLHFVYYDQHPGYPGAQCLKWVRLPFAPLRGLYPPELPVSARLRSAVVDEGDEDFLCVSYTLLVPLPVFPLEIVDYIIGYLGDCAKSLIACALTCYAWSKASRSRLFRTININRMAALGRLLGIESSSTRLQTPLFLMRSVVLSVGTWGYEALVALGAHHSQITSLTMSGRSSPIRMGSDVARVRSLCQSLSALTALELTEYTFQHVRELVTFLDAVPRLTKVVLQNVEAIHMETLSALPPPSQALRLQSLEIVCMPELTAALLEWLALTPSKDTLQHISFCSVETTDSDVYRNFQAMTPSLSSICLLGEAKQVTHLLTMLGRTASKPLVARDLRLHMRPSTFLSAEIKRLGHILHHPTFATVEHLVVIVGPQYVERDIQGDVRDTLSNLSSQRGVICEYQEVGYGTRGPRRSQVLNILSYPHHKVHEDCRIMGFRLTESTTVLSRERGHLWYIGP